MAVPPRSTPATTFTVDSPLGRKCPKCKLSRRRAIRYAVGPGTAAGPAAGRRDREAALAGHHNSTYNLVVEQEENPDEGLVRAINVVGGGAFAFRRGVRRHLCGP